MGPATAGFFIVEILCLHGYHVLYEVGIMWNLNWDAAIK